MRAAERLLLLRKSWKGQEGGREEEEEGEKPGGEGQKMCRKKQWVQERVWIFNTWLSEFLMQSFYALSCKKKRKKKREKSPATVEEEKQSWGRSPDPGVKSSVVPVLVFAADDVTSQLQLDLRKVKGFDEWMSLRASTHSAPCLTEAAEQSSPVHGFHLYISRRVRLRRGREKK